MRRHHSRAFETLFQAALALQQSGLLREAIDYYQRAIRTNDTVAEAHNNLGCAFLALGRLEDSIAAFERALDLRPDYAEALDNLGLTRAQLEQHDEAVALHDHAAAISPTNATIRIHLGNALLAVQRYEQARTAFEAALRYNPGDAAALNGLGAAFDHLGRNDEAEAAFRAALASNPTFGDAACNLGSILLNAGDIDSARAWFERALAFEPRNGRYHFYVVLSRSGSVDDSQIAAMERLEVESSELSPAERVHLQFALASVYETTGDYDVAFQHLIDGNALKRKSIRYDETATLQFAALLMIAFTKPFIDALGGWGNPTARPLFILGMPRSGTTLVEQLLASQPAVCGAGELPVLGLLARELWQRISDGMRLSDLGAQIRTFGDRYVTATDHFAENATYVTDKMPSNFWYVPLIHLALPNARIIHVRRDRLDTCVSCFATLFEEGTMPYAYDLGEIARYYQAYEQMMAKWRTLLPKDRFIEVHYEQLIGDFETEARRLVAFCGLPWDAGALAFHEVRRPVRTASNIQVRRPLYRSAVGRSRRFAAQLAQLDGFRPEVEYATTSWVD